MAEDANRRILVVNDEFCRLFGIPVHPDRLYGYDCRRAAEEAKDLFEDPAGFLRGIERALEAKQIVRGERLRLRDGRMLERDYLPMPFGAGIHNLWQYREIRDP
ncbi:MAG TPA: hypothetical protein VM681_05155 [Candidatus Thermoplasmatota archaeon]|nr:hypothetical protein [Candidatus Thermoplasmatota archaeon]